MKSGAHRYIRNAAWLIAEKTLRLVASLAVGVYVTRYLGPEQFGLLSYAISFVTLFSILGGLGIEGVVIRDIIREPAKTSVLLGTALGLRLLGTMLMVGAILAITLAHESSALIRGMIAWVTVGSCLLPITVIDYFLQASVQGRLSAIAQTVQLAASSALKIGLVLAEADLIWFATAAAVDGLVLATCFLTAFRWSHHPGGRWQWNPKEARRILSSSWPLMLSGASILIYLRIDEIMIKSIIGASALGQYAAAVRISESWYFVPVVITASLFPAIVNASERSAELYRARLEWLFNGIAILALGVGLAAAIGGGWLAAVLFGPSFKATGQVLAIHAWAGIFVSFAHVSGKWILIEDLQRVALWRALAGAVLCVALNFILIPRYGIIGAAWAKLLALSIALHGLYACSERTRDIFFMQSRALSLAWLPKLLWDAARRLRHR